MGRATPLGDRKPDQLIRCAVQLDTDTFPIAGVRIEGDLQLDADLLPRRLAELCDSAYRTWLAASAEAIAWWRKHGEPTVPLDQWVAECEALERQEALSPHEEVPEAMRPAVTDSSIDMVTWDGASVRATQPPFCENCKGALKVWMELRQSATGEALDWWCPSCRSSENSTPNHDVAIYAVRMSPEHKEMVAAAMARLAAGKRS